MFMKMQKKRKANMILKNKEDSEFILGRSWRRKIKYGIDLLYGTAVQWKKQSPEYPSINTFISKGICQCIGASKAFFKNCCWAN